MKKVAIMQPYFFPYLGYFSLIKNTDEFILLDEVQFIRHGWIERNRILKQNEGWLYVKVALVKHEHKALIKDIKIDDNQDWKRLISAQLEVYKKVAPNYKAVIELLNQIFSRDFDNIVSLNQAALESICQYLNIDKPIKVFSKMNLTIESPKVSDEWALNICKALGDVTEYWNPPGGQDIFDKAKYDTAGIELKFQQVKLDAYDQKRQPFEPGLSIIDVLMFNSVEKVNDMLNNFELIP